MGRSKLTPWPGIFSAAGLGLVALALSAGQCRASLLAFTFDPNGPDVTGSSGSLSYDANTGEFQSTLIPSVYYSASVPGPSQMLTLTGSPSLSLDLFVNPDGTFQANGAGFELLGSMLIGSTTISGVLLSGSVAGFGTDPAGPAPYEFDGLLDITGGQLTQPAPLIGGGTLPIQFPSGSVGAFDLQAEDVVSGILGDFLHSYSADRVEGEAGAVVPEPSTWTLLAAGLTMLLLARGAGGRGLKCRKMR